MRFATTLPVRQAPLLDERMDPIKRFTGEQYEQALESWSWLNLAGKSPRFTSLFGDVFFEAADGWWFLDTMDGELAQVWPAGTDVQRAINTTEVEDRYLSMGLARDVERRGVQLDRNEVYTLTPPPVLGGALDAANVSATDFVVAVNLDGQIHDQIRDLPPGTPITGLTIT